MMSELCLFPSPIIPPVGQLSSIGNGRCFSFLLSNNTSNQYGVCLQFTRTFKDLSKGVHVTCDYCVCMISKLPFLSYLFNLLLQLDAQGGLDFLEPVQRFNPDNFLIPPTFKILVEFTRLLRGVKVPLYRLGAKYLARDYVEEDVIRSDVKKSSYSPISFNMVVKPVLTDGVLGHFMDLAAHSYGISQAVAPPSQYVSSPSPPLSKSSKATKKSLFGVFRRDLMGSYSSLPPAATQTKPLLPTTQPEPPFLQSPRRNISDSLLAQLEEEREKEVCFHTLLWALPALLRHLPLDQIILAVGCALTEMRVVVVGTDLGVVSGCVLALVNLLRPLKWAGPVIVTLPSSLHAYLESPVPLILGMQSLPEGFKLAPGIIMIDPKERMVNLHQTDVVASHTLILPKSIKLMHSLRVTGEIILRLTRKRNGTGSMSPMGKEQGRRSTSPQSSLHRALSGHNLESSTSTYGPPLPIELDVESANGKKLMAAVCGFSATMASHLETIINTMLQLAVDEKRSRRKMVQEAGESRSPLRRHSTLSLTPPALANSSSSRRTGMRSRGLKKILSRERENALSPRVSTKGMSKKETAPPVAVPVPSSSIPSKELYRSIHEESLLDGTSSDKQNTPTIPSAAGERPLPLPSGPASSSTAYPANPANPANSSKTVPMGDLSESDSDTDSQSSGKDSCSKASTMTRSGSSTSISIGHTKKATVVFSKKELGDGGLRFLARMRESQMFCNYCHTQSLKRKAHRQHGDRRATPSMSRSRSDLENLNLNYHDDVVLGNAVVERCRSGESGVRGSGRYPYNNDMKSITISEKSYSGLGQGLGLDEDKEKDDEDCLVTLFKIMLTGTIPMKQSRLNELISSYERDENRLKNENFKSTSSVPIPLPIPSYFSPILPSSPVSISYKHQSRSEKYKYSSSTSLGDSKKEALLEDGIVWCNGRCNGAANGPFCSSICLKIWDERVLQAKRILGVKQTIARQHHSDLVMNDIILPLGDRISIRPRADVTRHRSETVSQYELRLKNDLEHGNNLTSTFTKTVARSRKVQSLPFSASHTKNVLSDLSTDPEPYSNYWYSTPGFAPSTTHDPIPSKKKIEDIYPEFPDSPDSPPLWLEGEERRLSQSTNPLYRKRAANTSNRKRPNSMNSAYVSNSNNPLLDTNYSDPPVTSSAKYSGVSTGSNSATRAIAQHYRERHQQQRRSSLTNAMSVLAPFLLSCINWFRERNQFIACVIIQSVMRGYFIRRDVHHLILFLRFRKCLRMLARLSIRNWARKRADSLHSMRASRRLAKLRSLPALVAVNMEEFRAVPHGVCGSRLSTARTDHSDISSVTNIDERLLLVAHARTSFLSVVDNTRRTDANSVLGALEGEEVDGQEGSDIPGLEGNTHRSDCNSGYLSSSGTGRMKERVFPVIPHLVGSPFNTSSASPLAITTTPTVTSIAGGGAAGTGGTSTSPTGKSSNMRRLSVRLSERAIGLFGFLRGGSHHRSSASLVIPPSEVDLSCGTRQGSILSSYNMNSHSHHYDEERMPLDATSSRKFSHYFDFSSVEELSPSHPTRVLSDCSPVSLAGCSASRSSKGMKGTSRVSMAQSEDLDDLGTVTPFDPQSRHSSLYEMNATQQHTAMNSTHSMTFGIEQVQSPPGTPHSSGHEIEIITDSDLIWDTQPAPHDRVAAHVNEEEGHPVDDLNSHSPTNSSPPISTSPSKQRKHNTRNGSVTSVTSIATTGSTSPEKYPYDKTAGWFNVGRSGFSKDKDREIPIVTKGHLRLKDGVCGQEHLDSELIDAECRMNNVTVRKNVFSKMNSGKFRSQSAIFSSHRVSEFHAAGYTEKRGLSFCDRLKEGHTPGAPLLRSDAMDGAVDFAPFIKQLQESPPEMMKSASENTRKTSQTTANIESAAAAATALRPIMLTSILPFEDADDTQYISPGSESPKSPNTRSSGSAFPNLDPGSRPSNLLITGSDVARLGSDLSHPSTTFDDILDEGVSSRSRQNSDGSENYDVLLGIGNNFSLDYDDSHRMIRLNANGEVTTDPGDNSPGDTFKFARSSSGRSKVRPRNRPASVVLRSLGFAAKGNITPQQLQILLRMRELLRTGVDVLKHGRGGRPKKRVLFCESEFSKLCWRKPCVLSTKFDTDPMHFSPAPPTRSHTCMGRFIGPANGPKSSTISRAGWVKSDNDRTMLLCDIMEVRDDIGTDVMRRSLIKQFVAGSEQTCIISIVLANRTLDFEIEEHSWRPIFHALQILVNFYRVILPSVQTQRLAEEQRILSSRG